MKKKEVRLLAMELVNFKGIKHLEIPFDGTDTEIAGDNATGKTTVMDAFIWCLFGKDSQDRPDSGRGAFTLKTVDTEGKVIERIDHAVTVRLQVNDRETSFTRRIKENWVKPRREEEVVLKGNDTIYQIADGGGDSIEVKAKDYNERVNSIMSESLFKLITNPAYFPAQHWETQREALISMAGNITIEGVAKGRENFENILKQLDGKDLAQFKEEVAFRIKKIKEEMSETDPTLKGIDEGTPQAPDYESLEARKKELQKELDDLYLSITDINEASRQFYDKQQEKQKQIAELNAKKDTLYYDTRTRLTKAVREKKEQREASLQEYKTGIQAATTELRAKDDSLYSIDSEIRRAKDRIKDLDEQIDRKREVWIKRNAQVYEEKEGSLVCPLYNIVCQDTEANRLNRERTDAARESFLKMQNKDLDLLNKEGTDLAQIKEAEQKRLEAWEQKREAEKAEQQQVSDKLERLKKQLAEAEENTPEVNETIDPHSDEELAKQFLEIDKRIKEIKDTIQIADSTDEERKKKLTDRRKEISAEIEEIVKELAKKSIIEDNNRKRQKVLARDKELSQQKTELERQEYTATELHNTYISEVEQRVNEKFKLVKFKMFEKQINRAEVPTCVAMLGGVKYADLNSAGKINAGLDIINTIQEFNSISAPIFIDNSESVNVIYPINSQKILLRVTEDPRLTITKNPPLTAKDRRMQAMNSKDASRITEDILQ